MNNLCSHINFFYHLKMDRYCSTFRLPRQVSVGVNRESFSVRDKMCSLIVDLLQ